MATFDSNPDIVDLVINLSSTRLPDNLWMQEYLRQSQQRLEAITEMSDRGETIDRGSHDWMLNQVDFIVESLGSETGELNDSLRSNLLQLILAIANLNQKLRGNIGVPFEPS